MSTHARFFIILGIGILILIPIALFVPRGADEPMPVEDPEVSGEDQWRTYADDTLTFQHPESLDTTFMHATDWPPVATVSNEPWSCAPMSNERGETREATRDGIRYCATSVSEGAAGSVYTEYQYAYEKDGRTVTLSFTVRATQCANYDEPDRNACAVEREDFDADDLALRMFRTLTLN